MAEVENWQFNKSALECHKYMLDHHIATDVTFVVSNKLYGTEVKGQIKEECREEKLQAHKYQLISRSPVFYAMFCGELAENGEIVVDDIDPSAFREMLNYIYTDEVDMKPELAMLILYASKKYLLPGLTQICVEYLANELTCDNACILYDHGLVLDEPDLSERSLVVIKNSTKACLQAQSFLHVRQSTLSNILDSERFTSQEVDVFAACENWARYQVQQSGREVNREAMRLVLGDCIAKIRYPTMTAIEFGTAVAPKDVLLPEEEIKLFRYLSIKDKETPPPKLFCADNRHVVGPFSIMHEGDCTNVQITGTKTEFTIVSNQTITIKKLLLGDVTDGVQYAQHNYHSNILLAQPLPPQIILASSLCVNDVNFGAQEAQWFIKGKKCGVDLHKNLTLKANSKHSLVMPLKCNTKCPNYMISQYPQMKCASSREFVISDKKTDLEMSVKADNPPFLLGMEYDFI